MHALSKEKCSANCSFDNMVTIWEHVVRAQTKTRFRHMANDLETWLGEIIVLLLLKNVDLEHDINKWFGKMVPNMVTKNRLLTNHQIAQKHTTIMFARVGGQVMDDRVFNALRYWP